MTSSKAFTSSVFQSDSIRICFVRALRVPWVFPESAEQRLNRRVLITDHSRTWPARQLLMSKVPCHTIKQKTDAVRCDARRSSDPLSSYCYTSVERVLLAYQHVGTSDRFRDGKSKVLTSHMHDQRARMLLLSVSLPDFTRGTEATVTVGIE